MTPAERLLKVMRLTVQKIKKIRPVFPHGVNQSFVLKYGQSYEPQPLPKGFRMGQPKQCYFNSAVQAVRKPNLIYVEGFAIGKGFPDIHHAWLVERGSNKVIDRTTVFDAYFGIPFRTAFVRKQWNTSDGLPIMGDVEGGGYPLFEMTDAEIRAVIESPT